MGAKHFVGVRQANTLGHYLEAADAPSALCGLVPERGWVRVEPVPEDFEPLGFCPDCRRVAIEREQPLPA